MNVDLEDPSKALSYDGVSIISITGTSICTAVVVA
jgi:hypothetical protein